ncbi:hypothetical protein CK215_30145 [Mesorhizobium sp. WSM3864]|nr:hypothetical protein CK215_30145 [Mesorhizobium sp. WSM3864]
MFEAGKARQTVQYVQVPQLDYANEKQFLTTDSKSADRTQPDYGQTQLMAIAWSPMVRLSGPGASVAFD